MSHRSPRAFAPGASSRGLFPTAALLATIVPAHADRSPGEETDSIGLAGFVNGIRRTHGRSRGRMEPKRTGFRRAAGMIF